MTSEVKFKTVTSKSMGKIDGKNNYEESKYMRERPSLNIPIFYSQFSVPTLWSFWSFGRSVVFYDQNVHTSKRPSHMIPFGRSSRLVVRSFPTTKTSAHPNVQVT
ncbi:hypothetical protein M501DRAFT_1003475 [Patellaria atrata CBS 101060]|uniref:Uncharacterized protein n=1 Tax=Patellaria atrata CBS 101060 TaxID=1346257 RepID=A0A9P4VS19_9PEZI|nr:hypothetical protein M501DRAFT_1003475 [Patellaria atrata CBS 101060]